MGLPVIRRLAEARYARRLLIRGLLLWLAVRLAVSLLALGAGTGSGMSVPGALIIAATVAFLCNVDARFMSESIFHANLGTSMRAPAVAGAAVALACETTLALLAAAWG
jgi:hypothetical protein